MRLFTTVPDNVNKVVLYQLAADRPEESEHHPRTDGLRIHAGAGRAGRSPAGAGWRVPLGIGRRHETSLYKSAQRWHKYVIYGLVHGKIGSEEIVDIQMASHVRHS
jgi:hypothetical protein